jgi:hypothetical protein
MGMENFSSGAPMRRIELQHGIDHVNGGTGDVMKVFWRVFNPFLNDDP